MDEQVKRVASQVVQIVSPVFKVPAAEFDTDRPLRDYGLDSILAVELQAALEEKLGLQLSTMELLAGRPVEALAELILKRALVESAAIEEKQSQKPKNADLTQYFLDRICVQRPYFSLSEIEEKGEYLYAKVHPVPAAAVEVGPVSLAEAARHTAILGSCAARELEMRRGKIYFPVRKARLLALGNVPHVPPDEALVVEARCISYDTKTCSAVAETRLLTLTGALLWAIEITYHVIHEEEFIALFAAHHQPTFESQAGDPHQHWRPLPLGEITDGCVKIELGTVSPSWCLGHFVGYPAYPVSIMVRDCLRAISQGVTAKLHNDKPAKIRVIGGASETSRFVFANSQATLTAKEIAPVNGTPVWRAEITADGELCAWFEMEIEIIRD